MQVDLHSDPSPPAVRLSVACSFCLKSSFPLVKNDAPATLRRSQLPSTLAASPPSVSPSIAKSAIVNIKSDICTCGNPRPRCSFCLLRLNTPATPQMFRPSSFKIERDDDGQASIKRINRPFGAFTVFCVTCSHSGHANHYLNWFKDNSICPVSGCDCSCFTLDSLGQLNSNRVTN